MENRLKTDNFQIAGRAILKTGTIQYNTLRYRIDPDQDYAGAKKCNGRFYCRNQTCSPAIPVLLSCRVELSSSEAIHVYYSSDAIVSVVGKYKDLGHLT